MNGRETPLSRLFGGLIVVRLWCCSTTFCPDAVRQIAAANQRGRNFANRRSKPQANCPPPPKALVNLYAASRNWVGRSVVIFICMEGVQSREQWIIQLVISQQLISNCSVSLTQVWQRPAVVPRERWGPLRFSPMLSRRLRVSVGTWYDYT